MLTGIEKEVNRRVAEQTVETVAEVIIAYLRERRDALYQEGARRPPRDGPRLSFGGGGKVWGAEEEERWRLRLVSSPCTWCTRCEPPLRAYSRLDLI